MYPIKRFLQVRHAPRRVFTNVTETFSADVKIPSQMKAALLISTAWRDTHFKASSCFAAFLPNLGKTP